MGCLLFNQKPGREQYNVSQSEPPGTRGPLTQPFNLTVHLKCAIKVSRSCSVASCQRYYTFVMVDCRDTL